VLNNHAPGNAVVIEPLDAGAGSIVAARFFMKGVNTMQPVKELQPAHPMIVEAVTLFNQVEEIQQEIAAGLMRCLKIVAGNTDRL